MPQPRELTDGYRLEKMLASSRSASVLGGTHLATGRAVVIKLINLPAPASAAADRFVEYAAALSRLRHPNLPVVYDSGLTPDGAAFLVMEPLTGVPFDSVALGLAPDGGDLSASSDGSQAGLGGTSASDRILPLLDQAAVGLEELARHGLSHWNICPGNLLVVPTPQGEVVKLLGLGTPLFYLGAPWPEPEGARFRAPELAQPAAAALLQIPGLAGGAAAIDWHADGYSLALTASNALGATVAFGDASGPIVQMPLALSFELANDEALRRILELCLRPAPSSRPTHAAIRDAFRLALGGEGAAAAAAAAAPAPTAPIPVKAPAIAPAAPAVPPEAPAIVPGAPRSVAPAEAGQSDWRAALSRSQAPPTGPTWLGPNVPPPPPPPRSITGAMPILSLKDLPPLPTTTGSASATTSPAAAGPPLGDYPETQALTAEVLARAGVPARPASPGGAAPAPPPTAARPSAPAATAGRPPSLTGTNPVLTAADLQPAAVPPGTGAPAAPRIGAGSGTIPVLPPTLARPVPPPAPIGAALPDLPPWEPAPPTSARPPRPGSTTGVMPILTPGAAQPAAPFGTPGRTASPTGAMPTLSPGAGGSFAPPPATPGRTVSPTGAMPILPPSAGQPAAPYGTPGRTASPTGAMPTLSPGAGQPASQFGTPGRTASPTGGMPILSPGAGDPFASPPATPGRPVSPTGAMPNLSPSAGQPAAPYGTPGRAASPTGAMPTLSPGGGQPAAPFGTSGRTASPTGGMPNLPPSAGQPAAPYGTPGRTASPTGAMPTLSPGVGGPFAPPPATPGRTVSPTGGLPPSAGQAAPGRTAARQPTGAPPYGSAAGAAAGGSQRPGSPYGGGPAHPESPFDMSAVPADLPDLGGAPLAPAASALSASEMAAALGLDFGRAPDDPFPHAAEPFAGGAAQAPGAAAPHTGWDPTPGTGQGLDWDALPADPAAAMSGFAPATPAGPAPGYPTFGDVAAFPGYQPNADPGTDPGFPSFTDPNAQTFGSADGWTPQDASPGGLTAPGFPAVASAAMPAFSPGQGPGAPPPIPAFGTPGFPAAPPTSPAFGAPGGPGAPPAIPALAAAGGGFPALPAIPPAAAPGGGFPAPPQVPAFAPAGGTASGAAPTAARPGAAASGQPPGAPGAPAGTAGPAGDMLSAVDDLLDSLPPPPPAPGGAAAAPPVRGARPQPASGGQRMAAQPAARSRTSPLEALRAMPRAALFGGAGAILVVILVTGAWLALRHRAQPAAGEAEAAAAGAPVEAAMPPKLGPSGAAKFAEAESYLIMGRDYDTRVRQALHAMTYADQAEIGEAGCQKLAAIEQTLTSDALETVPQDLAAGLRNGDLATLETVTEVAGSRDVPPNLASDFERAKNLTGLYLAAQAASARGDQAAVLDRFHAMEGLSRTLHDPLELRDKAAAALEADAAAAARDGRYDAAVGALEPLRRNWPERSGVKDLVKTYETAATSETQQLAILDNVPAYLRRRKPSEGLDLLRNVKPTPHLEQRIAEARQSLEAQLAQLDAQPPQVTLRDGYLLDYSRGQVVNLSFRVTDDYEVKSVRLFARAEGSPMREMPLRHEGLGYSIDLPPSFHQNGTVDFYVVATDLSGHEGTLGSKEKPLQLKRRQGFERLIQ